MRYAITLLSSLILILLLGLIETSPAASLIYSENFEDGDSYDTYGSNESSYWSNFTDSTDVTTNDPHGGVYSLRGSISEESTLDDITGEAGVVNPHANIGAGVLTYGNTSDFDLDASISSGEFYISWYHRWDEDELVNLSSDTHKVIYIYTNYPYDYFILSISHDGIIRLIVNADHSAGYPYTAGDNASNDYQYGYNLGTYASIDDDSWHHFEFYTKMGTGGGADTEIVIAIDDVEVLNVTDADATYSTGDEVEFISLPSNLSAASTTVTSVGWQIDDIEIWDGDPGASGSETYCSDADNDNYYLAGSCASYTTDPGGDYELYSTFSGEDCDDTDGTLTDNCTSTTITCYKDTDGDGYSDGTSETVTTCSTGYYESGDLTATSGDCDDTSATYTPASSDPCYDCDSETACVSYTYYYDPDGDGYGDGTSQTATIDPGSYWYLESELTATTGDCDNDDALYTPASSDPCYDCNASTLCGGGGSFSGSEGSMNFTGSGVLNIQ